MVSLKEIHEGISVEIGYATVKRILAKLKNKDLIVTDGRGKGTKYGISPSYTLLKPIDVEEYFAAEIDDRAIKESFDLDLIPELLPKVSLFSPEELAKLHGLQEIHENNIRELSESEYKKELERLAIDLSWKSPR